MCLKTMPTCTVRWFLVCSNWWTGDKICRLGKTKREFCTKKTFKGMLSLSRRGITTVTTSLSMCPWTVEYYIKIDSKLKKTVNLSFE